MTKPFRSEEHRAATLANINEVLSSKNLKPMKKLGRVEEGETEIVELLQVFDHKFYVDLEVKVVFPNGKEGKYYPRFNMNSAVSDGAVIYALLNGKVPLVKQWRPAMGRWMEELPRGFAELGDAERYGNEPGEIKIAQLPLGTIVREFGEEAMAGARITGFTYLGNITADSAFYTATPAYALVHIAADPKAIEARLRGSDDEVAAVRLWSPEELWQAIGTRIIDSHSITAIALVKRAVESMPRF